MQHRRVPPKKVYSYPPRGYSVSENTVLGLRFWGVGFGGVGFQG